MKHSSIQVGIIVCLVAVVLFDGCSAFSAKEQGEKTQIIASRYGGTTYTKTFKTASAPQFHIFWEDDVPDGAQCKVTLSYITQGSLIFRMDFIRDNSFPDTGYNPRLAKTVQADPNWSNKPGSYLYELYINGRKKSSSSFSIIP